MARDRSRTTFISSPRIANWYSRRGLLQLEPRVEGPGYYMPIDRFFRSLAETQGSRSSAIVLSGSGSDGVIGLQAIKAEGGITFAQDESATHGGMPRSAIAAGCVDFVLPPEKIAEELQRISRHEYLNGSSHGAAPAAGDSDADDGFQDVVHYLQKTCGVDFEHYKRPTLRRRIERRMLLRHFSTLSDYLDLPPRRPWRGRCPVPGHLHPRHQLFPRCRRARVREENCLSADHRESSVRYAHPDLGSRAARPARKCIRSRS